jgi:outer membrane protein assembly factor BamB
VVVLREDDIADILDARTGQVEVSARLPFAMRAWHAQLVASPRGGFCAVGTPVGDMEIACLDDRGRVLWRKAYGLRRAGDTGSPGFSLRSVGPRYAIFGTLFFGAEVRRAVVVRLADGAEIARVEEEVAAVVERDDGSLEGLLVPQPEVKLLEPSGKPRWSAGALAPNDHGAAAVASGTRVYAALYPPISSGSELYAFDRATGKVLWRGDVERPSVGHSEYENEVSLSLFEDRLVLRAEESAVTGLQVFSLPDGKRLFSDMRFRE